MPGAGESQIRLEHCPQCGYSLEGLPSEGNCPECGRGYDQSIVVLYGWGCGEHANLGTSRLSRQVWQFIWVGLFLGCFYFQFRLGGWYQNIWNMAFLGWIAIGTIRFVAMRAENHFPGLVQVRLDASGCMQRDDLSGDSIWKHLQNLFGVVYAAVVVAYFGAQARRHVVADVVAGLIVLIIFIISRAGRLWRRRDANAMFPWSQVDAVSIESASQGHCRLRVKRRRRWLELENVIFPVDAEVKCTTEQAVELRLRIDDWRDAVRAAPVT